MASFTLRNALPKANMLRRGILSSQRRTLITLSDHLYTAHATASGAGRNGHAKSNDGTATPLDIKLSLPKALGGDGKGHNPEQLFATGYSACFLGALQAVAIKEGKKEAVKDAKIDVAVHIGTPTDRPGFGIAVDIKVHGVHDKALVHAAHEFCPYSRILTHGATVHVHS